MSTVADDHDTSKAQLDTALDLMRRKALARYPDDETRITLGYGIAQTGGVELLPDGTAMVASQTFQDTRYAVKKGACVCHDAKFRKPGTFCKHRWARQVWINAQRLLTAQAASLTTTRTGTQYYTHTEYSNVMVLLGKKTLANPQRTSAGGIPCMKEGS